MLNIIVFYEIYLSWARRIVLHLRGAYMQNTYLYVIILGNIFYIVIMRSVRTGLAGWLQVITYTY